MNQTTSVMDCSWVSMWNIRTCTSTHPSHNNMLQHLHFNGKTPYSMYLILFVTCVHVHTSSSCSISTGCIRKLLYYPNHSRPEVDCSKCHTVTNVKDRRADTLPKNYGLLEILGTSSTFCCPPVSDKLEQEKKTTSPEEEIHYCREHGDRISSYCIEDNTLVCSSCLLYGEHKGHHSLFVNSAAEQEREKLMKLNPAVFRQRKEMETALAKVEARIVEVQQAGERYSNTCLLCSLLKLNVGL